MYYFSDCLAHPPNDYLKDHLESVAKANEQIFSDNPRSLQIAAVVAGLAHDLGKASRWFQDRVYEKTTKKSKYSRHSLVSAIMGWHLASSITIDSDDYDRIRMSVFTAVLKHHTNLKDSWADEVMQVKHEVSAENEETGLMLKAQLNSMDLAGMKNWIESMVDKFDLPLDVPDMDTESIIGSIKVARPMRLSRSFGSLEHAVDYLCVFSGLCHFDKIHSATGAIERQRYNLPENSVREFIDSKISKQSNMLSDIRNAVLGELQKEILAHGSERFFTLTAPTGSGKTLAVLNAALKLRHQIGVETGAISPIIYCLPFTSIIDQNYSIYSSVLQNSGIEINSEIILKHHHLSDPRYVSSDPEFDVDDSELFTETWRSELVVSTFYQLLHTMISAKNRNLKRFVSLKNAIVILDEVQAIPYKYWNSIRQLFQVVGEKLNVRFILMTATQPLLFTTEMAIELLPDHSKYFDQLSRVKLINRAESETTLEDFAEIASKEMVDNPSQSRMFILNRKSSVKKLFHLLSERFIDRRVFALSTNLTPFDRKRRIGEIKTMLDDGQPCVIVTTQLIEAGVDMSVDVVDRDLAPLDSLIQSAGRCNRHNSETIGTVNLWLLTDDNGSLWKKVYDPFLVETTREVLRGKSSIEEREFLQLGSEYFNLICKRSESSDIHELITEGRFSELASQFKLIDESGYWQSYFIIKDDADEGIWNEYESVQRIEDRIERKKEFNLLKGEFMERIVQIRTNELIDGITAMHVSDGLYDDELGILEAPKSPGSVIL